MPAGLLMTSNVSSSKTISSGIASGKKALFSGFCWTITLISSPAYTLCFEVIADWFTVTNSFLIHSCNFERENSGSSCCNATSTLKPA